MTVGRLAALSGVPASTLRYYDRLGLLPADRDASGHRRYDATRTLAALQAIALCRRLGSSLDEAAQVLRMPDGPSPQRRALAGQHLEELDRRIEELRAARPLLEHLIGCTCPDLPTCLAVQHDLAAAAPGREGDPEPR